MADTVTKKDLADLEKRINKAFADETAMHNKIIESINKRFAQITADLIKIISAASEVLSDRISALEKKCG